MDNHYWYCYILKSSNSNNTYNGSTNDIVRRLRQHNGELTGGALRTKLHRPWEYIAILRGFPNHKNALSCEWKIRHPVGSAKKRKSAKFSGAKGRILSLNEIFRLDKWTNKCEEWNKDIPKLDLWILREYSEHLDKNLPDNVIVHEVDKIIPEEL